MPPVIGKIRAPSWSLAVPVAAGVSLRLVSASTKPWSSVTWVVLPVSESIEATGAGAALVSEVDEDEDEELSSLLPQAAMERLVAAMSATAAKPLRVLLESMVLMRVTS